MKKIYRLFPAVFLQLLFVFVNVQAFDSLNKDAFVEVGERAIPAVVFIECKAQKSPKSFGNSGNAGNQFSDEFFKHFFGINPSDMDKNQPYASSEVVQRGSGFFISSEGHILTNYHIIKGCEEGKIKVTLNDHRKYNAHVIGKDSKSDLAVLKIDEKNLSFLSMGDSDDLKVGEFVAAIGNPFGINFAETLTTGIVSAKGRSLDEFSEKLNISDFIQTDAAINQGNSGGPLLNLKAEVVGINTAIISPTGGFLGLGFAIPSNVAKRVIDDLINKGNVEYGYLGISVKQLEDNLIKYLKEYYNFDGNGIEVINVVEGSPADKAGLCAQDIIIKVNDDDIENIKNFSKKIQLLDPGTVVKITINRKGKVKALKVTLGKYPEVASYKDFENKLGFKVRNLFPEEKHRISNKDIDGVVVEKVDKSNKVSLRLQRGLLITEVNGKKIKSVEEFYKVVEESKSKDILMTVMDGRMSFFVTVRIE